jgi:hypothetical protein
MRWPDPFTLFVSGFINQAKKYEHPDEGGIRVFVLKYYPKNSNLTRVITQLYGVKLRVGAASLTHHDTWISMHIFFTIMFTPVTIFLLPD